MSEATIELAKSTEINLVFLHGWGMNSGAWASFSEYLATLDFFANKPLKIHYLDLPGYGNNVDVSLEQYSIEFVAEFIAAQLPENSVLIGWSLGGLIASYLAAQGSEKIIGLLTLCSSPKFMQENDWRGIKPEILMQFEQQLNTSYQLLIRRFIAIQTMGTLNHRQDSKHILECILSHPAPSTAVLHAGLDILKNTDLRSQLAKINLPACRIYGRLDSLVPSKAINDIDALFPQSEKHVIDKAAHAPFVSHPESLATILESFLTANFQKILK